MTKPRIHTNGYITLIVQPTSEFKPTNWRQSPEAYQVVEIAGPSETLGQADAWKFLHNQSAIKSDSITRWAIHISLKNQSLRCHIQPNANQRQFNFVAASP